MMTNVDKSEMKTREELKQNKKEKKEQREEVRDVKIRIRLFPIWLRLIIIVLAVAVSLFAGVAIGYGVIGSGEVKDAFKESTWTHVIDLVKKK
ncbi:DNA-directed RNA polymerase subunit beta [Bacillus suaedaesalsae]|uniref:DNA-directed RNA polymerase subunit beta n=1 Tax=Bacillus suaedaesalsae TaxID=2810349 RepID=A0ABS2DE50_9BACI|nr:DNA-directed RNA polymerase subunit beta [Bacillus suaedaesalsae]MBM6616713.1 DNA-directed RNA polymerase subunit beta [Bacillus suaedaesalsae]